MGPMTKSHAYFLTAAIACAGPLQTAAAAPAHTEIKLVVDLNIDPSTPCESNEQAPLCLLEIFRGADSDVRRLSLTVIPKIDENGEALTGVTFRAASGDSYSKPCEVNLDQRGAIRFDFREILDSNHYFLTIGTATAEQNPFAVVSCGYLSSPTNTSTLFLSGYYVYRRTPVATAESLDLIPVLPY